jgi:hypothetical protein
VDYLVADLITWQPPKTYGVVFFSFWLSHVPRSRFFGLPTTTASRPTPTSSDAIRIGRSAACMTEGEFQVVEVFYEPEELQSLLGDLGWTAMLDATRWFIFGEACLANAS